MTESTQINRIRDLVARTLNIADSTSIATDKSLFDYHLDSLSFAQLCDELESEFDVSLLSQWGGVMPSELTVEILSDRITRVAVAGPSDRGFSSPDLERDQPNEVRLYPAKPTPVISLATDDLVPNSMLIALGFPYDFSAQVAPAVQRGLDAFPHFAGRIVGTTEPFDLAVTPDAGGVRLQWQQDSARLDDVSRMSSEECIRRFFPCVADRDPSEPSAENALIRSPLLSICTTQLADGATVLGVLASHCLVDGVGLDRFVRCCLTPESYAGPSELIHSREAIRLDSGSIDPLPSWYRLEQAARVDQREWDLCRGNESTVFVIEDNELRHAFEVSEVSRWFQLTALLCRALGDIAGYSEIAMWCDIRGQLSIPPNYTGNVGCYWHEPIGGKSESTVKFARRIRHASSPLENPAVAEVYRSIKSAEASGQRVHWTGTQPHVLPVNLVPQSATDAQFRSGGPTLIRMLTRNLHGLRIYHARRPDRFMIEVNLPDGTATELLERCRSQGIQLRTLGESK